MIDATCDCQYAATRKRRIGKAPDPKTRGYQWPARYLTADDMAMLHEIRMDTNKPINHLLHEAVEMFYELFRNEG